jgi:hypothetical protein
VFPMIATNSLSDKEVRGPIYNASAHGIGDWTS